VGMFFLTPGAALFEDGISRAAVRFDVGAGLARPEHTSRMETRTHFSNKKEKGATVLLLLPARTLPQVLCQNCDLLDRL